MKYTLELTEYEAIPVHSAIDSLLHHSDKLLEEKYDKKMKIVKSLIAGKRGIKFTLFGTKKSTPYTPEAVLTYINQLKDLNLDIFTIDANLKALHSAINKLVIQGISQEIIITDREEREIRMWSELRSIFLEFSPDVTIQDLKDNLYAASI